MATPLSAGSYLSALKNEGLNVVEVAGWQGRNRNMKGAWGPMNGVMIHHTGSDTTDGLGYAAGFLANGSSALPGPLCHASIGSDGRVFLVGYGRANHAGGGDQASLDAVVSESIGNRELKPRYGNANGVDGNSHFYGVEVQYSGGHPMSGPQYDATVRWAAAICRAHGWSAQSVIGHREWSSDKWDPGQTDMIKFRADVQARLNTGLSKPVTPTAPARPTAAGGYAFFTRNKVDGAIYGVKSDGSRTHLSPTDYYTLGSPLYRNEINGFGAFTRDQVTGAIYGWDYVKGPQHLTPEQWHACLSAGAQTAPRWDWFYRFEREANGDIYGVTPEGVRQHLSGPTWAKYVAAGATFTQK